MRLQRRHFILGAGALGALGTAAAIMRYSFKDDIIASLSRSFGQDIAGSAAASEFADDLLTSFAGSGILPNRREALLNRLSIMLRDREYGPVRELDIDSLVIPLFVVSSNAVLAFERGDEPEYYGMFNPYGDSICVNPLSVLAL